MLDLASKYSYLEALCFYQGKLNKMAKDETAEVLPTVEECIEEIRRKPLVNLWPTLAVLYDVSKGKIYQMAELGEVDVLKTGRLKKAVSATERRKLGIEAA